MEQHEGQTAIATGAFVNGSARRRARWSRSVSVVVAGVLLADEFPLFVDLDLILAFYHHVPTTRFNTFESNRGLATV